MSLIDENDINLTKEAPRRSSGNIKKINSSDNFRKKRNSDTGSFQGRDSGSTNCI